MEYRRLGQSGLKVGRIGLGCMSYGDPTTTNAHTWALDDEVAQPFFRQAVEMGVTFWDTANTYQEGTSEQVVGRAIKRYSRREDIVLATKVFGRMHDGPGGQGLSRKAILEQVDASLTRLGTDYIDLYQIHRFDPEAPVDETMEALHDIVKAGKVRYIGASSMYAWQFAKLQHTAEMHGWTQFVAMQISTTCFDAKMSESCCPCAPTWAWAPCRTPPRAKDAWLGPGANSHTAPAWTRSSSPSTRLSTSPSSTQSNASPKLGARPWLKSRWRGCCTAPSSPHPSSERPSPITCQRRLKH
jgi:diketogulonate reductase-like aldo/keto reductase